jgi:hypothetical protein
MALARRIQAEVPSDLMLFLRPQHVELIIRSGGGISALRHLSVPRPAATEEGESDTAEVTRAIADLVARSVALMPRYGDNAKPERLVVWDGMDLGAEAIGTFGELISLSAQVFGTLENLGLVPPNQTSEGGHGRFASAAALALNRLRGDDFPLDFLHSRLEVREKTGISRRLARTAMLALAAVTAGALYLGQWRREEEELTALRQRMADMAADIEAAEDMVEQVTLARGWRDRRPRFLEPLRELTLSFPAEGRIWITNLAVRGDMRMLVSGKSGEERIVLDLLDRIRRNGSFDGVKLLHMREAGGGARGVAFSMTFDYVGGR